MFDKFGELDSCEEINELAENEAITGSEEEAVTQSRKSYINGLTVREAAVYIKDEHLEHRLPASSLSFASELEKWLEEEVDERGKVIY